MTQEDILITIRFFPALRATHRAKRGVDSDVSRSQRGPSKRIERTPQRDDRLFSLFLSHPKFRITSYDAPHIAPLVFRDILLAMANFASGYFLKEYGSWSVLIIAFLTGLIASRDFTWQTVPVFLALCLLINSKQALTKWFREKGRRTALIFLGQLAAATMVLIAVFGGDIPQLLPLLVFPAAYLLMSRFAGEHFILTEILGFALISLAAVLAKFTVTGGVDVPLFVAVALYFIAGVFKVKTLLRKKARDRVLTVLYVFFAAFVYRGFHISLIILLPLVDNLVAAALLYKVKLRTTGWIEVSKSILFLILMSIFYY